jgi:hypothetical protein
MQNRKYGGGRRPDGSPWQCCQDAKAAARLSYPPDQRRLVPVTAELKPIMRPDLRISPTKIAPRLAFPVRDFIKELRGVLCGGECNGDVR